MASRMATNRLKKELRAILSDPPPHIHVSMDEANILNWNYLLEGPPDTPYAGGWYWGILKFPKDYPFKPPSIMMMTPNGRFEINMRLCLSMSDYHPETWQPGWSVAAVLKALLSFMCEDSPTAGAIDPPLSNEEKMRFAASSREWNKASSEFSAAFPEFDEIVARTETAKGAQSSASTEAVEARSSDVNGCEGMMQGAPDANADESKESVSQDHGFLQPSNEEPSSEAPTRIMPSNEEEPSSEVQPSNLDRLKASSVGYAADAAETPIAVGSN